MRKSLVVLVAGLVLLIASIVVFYSTMYTSTSQCRPCGEDYIQEYWDAFDFSGNACLSICLTDAHENGETITYLVRMSNEMYMFLAWWGTGLLALAGIIRLWEIRRPSR